MEPDRSRALDELADQPAADSRAVPVGAAPNVLGAISLSYAESGRRYSAQPHRSPRRRSQILTGLKITTTADGLCWESRQSQPGRAVVLFGRVRGRGVRRSDLEVVVPPVPFAGEDKTFKDGFKLYAEKAPNAPSRRVHDWWLFHDTGMHGPGVSKPHASSWKAQLRQRLLLRLTGRVAARSSSTM